jgi:tetratricopeptide (TPR) repeat protein
VLRETQVQPVILVFEDLHWIDGATQALLDKLIESLPTSRLLLLVNYRPEYTHGWGSKTYYRQLRVDPLSTATAAELLKELLGSDPALAELQRLLIERTQCNPFFLEESVHALVETRALTGERGSYRLAGPIQNLQLPSTVQTILAARIDRLAPEDKRLLQAAVVIGKDVPHALLQAVADEPDERVRVALEHLRAAEFLYERSLFPELEYTFKHALTVEVAYASVLSDRRRDLHARVARTMVQLYTARLEEHAERLAYHALHGELWEDALRYSRVAGARAESRSAFKEAAAHYQAALAALARLPKDGANVEEAIDLHLLLRTPLWTIGRFDEVLVNLREAERLARELGDTSRLHYAEMYLYNLFWVVGNHGEWQRLFPQVQAVAAADDTNPSLRAYATMQLGQTCLATGDVGDITSSLASVLSIVDAGTPVPSVGEPRVQLRALIAILCAYLGDFCEGIARSAEAVEIADSVGTPYIQVYAIGLTALLHGWRGDFASSLPLADRGLRLAEAHGFITQIPFVLAARGWALCGLGRGDDGVPLLEQGIKVAESSSVLYWHTNLVATLAEGQLLAGDVNRSRDTAARALDLARARGEPGFEAWSLRLLGDVANASRAEAETAERSYRSALTLAKSLRLRPLVAHCHLGLGKLYRRTDKREQARKHLTTATTMYREMGMTYWLEKAEAEVRN